MPGFLFVWVSSLYVHPHVGGGVVVVVNSTETFMGKM